MASAGEIVGLAGIVGSGRTEVAHAIVGSQARQKGRVTLAGQEGPPVNPRLAIQRGIGFLTNDRKVEGLLAQLPVWAFFSARAKWRWQRAIFSGSASLCLVQPPVFGISRVAIGALPQ
ncbi:MAG: hypothetical protein ACOVQ8_03485 [Elstera sp.]|jgi:ABC-type sugar transport system ATPase subunit